MLTEADAIGPYSPQATPPFRVGWPHGRTADAERSTSQAAPLLLGAPHLYHASRLPILRGQMSERFQKPPLTELVAELRWSTGMSTVGPSGPGPIFMLAAAQYEDFFTRIGAKVALLGYERIERLVPPGFLSAPFQVVYRFRKKAPEEGTSIYQVGGGVFTANITPPYRSWAQFRPIVEQGVACLLETRNASEREAPFTSAGLRYINAFGPRYTEGRSAGSFVQDVLGLRVSLPEALRSELADDAEMKLLLQLSTPLKSRQQLNLVAAEGIVAGSGAVILDLHAVSETSIAPEKQQLMASFDLAHQAIHRVFVGLTTNISRLMEPIEEESS
ncbi:MAG: TIGR04255 family protein [Acetobacteraceae bacterium]